MSITLSSSKAAYLARVAAGLADLAAEDREEVVQDLEAHLAELGDDEVESMLGTPDAFVEEFRQSAGLDRQGRPPGLFSRIRNGLDTWSSRLSELIRWPSLRPTWVLLRGWVLIVGWSLAYYSEGFVRFPIPSIENSLFAGLVLVALATFLSLWLERGRRTRPKENATKLFSFIAGWALLAAIVTPYPIAVEHYPEDPYYTGYLNTPDGDPVSNIYAYDVEGNAINVLLYDQDGRPLLSLPRYVYEEAEFDPNRESISTEFGEVSFGRDQFGRIIPHLYPLQGWTYDERGVMSPLPPPSIGFPAQEGEVDENPVPTTTTPPFG